MAVNERPDRPDAVHDSNRRKGTAVEPSPPDIGTVVVDRDDDDPNEAIVVNRPPATADDWTVRARGCTLAEDNPEYPEDASVVVVVFRDHLADRHPEYDGREPISFDDLRADFYTFPEPRLEVVDELAGAVERDERELQDDEGDQADQDDVEAPEELLELANRLEDGGMVVEVDVGADAILAEKLGEAYRVTVDGEIEGDGALRRQLESVVAEVIGRS